jgi:thiamine-monophosphate kinase
MMNENVIPPTIESLGEFGLIKYLTEPFHSSQKTTVFGIGDDCAVLEKNDSHFTLVSNDMLLEGIHFDLMYVPLKHLGFKSVSVSVSDVFAMNGKAEQLVLSIGLSSRFPVEALKEFYEGVQLACDFYRIDLVGGDTSSSVQGLIISATVIGSVAKSDIVYRKGGGENDILLVSGDLGRAYLGLQILEREKEVFTQNPNVQPDLDRYDTLVKKQLKPEARLDVVDILAGMNVVPTSMIDISDGLASELFHLCTAGDLGCVIFEDKIPYAEDTLLVASEFNIPHLTCAMNGGEEYELLFSVSQKEYHKIQGNPYFTPIGHYTHSNEGLRLMDGGGSLHELRAQGWKHF